MSFFPTSKTLSAFVASDDGRPLIFEQLPFDHPLCIMYSSGTTGPPKSIVHSGGVCKRYRLNLMSPYTPVGRAHSNEERTCRKRQYWNGRNMFPYYKRICLCPCPS
jgi:acyl-CoA synthetase (AMP-forming)/AMP-acid ligase II